MNMAARDEVAVTITELEDMFASDHWSTCEAIANFGPGLDIHIGSWQKSFRRRVWWRSKNHCGKKAAALLTVTCPEHGTRQKPLCRRHLNKIKAGLPVSCASCDRPIRWIDTGA